MIFVGDGSESATKTKTKKHQNISAVQTAKAGGADTSAEKKKRPKKA